MDINNQKYKLDHRLRIKPDDLAFHIHNYDVDLVSNHIYLMGMDRGYEVNGWGENGVDYLLSKRFIQNLGLCMRANEGKPIVILMKTCGGDFNEGMAIYDAIKSCPSKVTILNYTHARSMSSIIFQAGDKRVMMPHSHFMFHDGTYADEGTVKQVKSGLDFYSKIGTSTMLDIYSEKMAGKGDFKEQPISKIKKWLRYQMDKKEDVYLTAEETIYLGLADEIFNYDWSSLTNY